MPDFTVLRRGTDSSGRGIFATDYMWDWWQAVCAELGFSPVVTQGAWMAKNGGGAKDSAGYHDGGGTFDLRVWNLTDEQVAKTVRTLRRHGAAAWLRNQQHGGFEDPHIHFVLGSDSGLTPGARSQWSAYLNGRDGLASNGPDYHWRPEPLVLKPPSKPKPARPTLFSLAVCNTMAASNASAAKGASILRKTLEAYPKAVIVGVVEASNLLDANAAWKPTRDTRDLCKIQGGPIDKAGVALVYDAKRVEVLKVKYVLGVLPFVRGKRVGMRNRWILRAKVRIDGRRARWVNVLHLPPPRFSALWPLMVAKVAHLGADLGDFNSRPSAVAAATGKRARMDGVLGVLVPAWWRSGKPRPADVGGDHKAVAVTIHHRRKEKS